MPSEMELALRLGVALVLGGAIGLERELSGQVAGLRTHMSVALGAALFGIVSAYGWFDFARAGAPANLNADVTRVAASIVTGVGFLGGGAIMKDGASVRGLTTAASLWVTAAVGLAAALGGYGPAALTTIALVLSLAALRAPRSWLRRRFILATEPVSIVIRPGADPDRVLAALRDLPVEIGSLSVGGSGHPDGDADLDDLVIRAEVAGTDLHARLGSLSRLDGVRRVQVGD